MSKKKMPLLCRDGGKIDPKKCREHLCHDFMFDVCHPRADLSKWLEK